MGRTPATPLLPGRFPPFTVYCLLARNEGTRPSTSNVRQVLMESIGMASSPFPESSKRFFLAHQRLARSSLSGLAALRFIPQFFPLLV